MRPWHLLPALVACAAASCYLPGGLEADEEWVPCNKVDGFAFCCKDGDTCLDSGLCSSKGGVRIQAGACQNADWSSCRHEIPDIIDVELKPRQATVTVGGVGPPASTVVVIATATQTRSVVVVTADPTSEPSVSATSESTHSSSSPKSLIPIIAGAAGGALLLVSLAALAFFCYRRKQKKRRLDAEIRASIQSDWLGQVTVGSGQRRSEAVQYHDRVLKSPPPVDMAGGGGYNPVEIGDTGRSSVPIEMGNKVNVVEIDDGRRVDLPVEMDAERSPPMSSSTQQPPWVVPKGVYEIG